MHDGSIKTWIAVLGSIYLAIGQYGSFRSGVDQLIQDSKSIKKYVVISLKKDGLDNSVIMDQKRVVSTPDKIRRLLLRIDRFEKKFPKLEEQESKNEFRGIVVAVSRIANEIDIEEDLNMFISSIDERFYPHPQELSIRHRLVLRKEEEYPTFPNPHQTNALTVKCSRRLKLTER